MLIFADEGGGGNATPPAPDATPADNTLPGGLPANDPNGEGTTPEEVTAVMKSAGITLPAEPTASAEDDEEGDDPEAPVAEGTGDEPAGDEAEPDSAEPDEPEDDDTPVPTDDEVKAAQEARAAEIAEKYSFTVEDASGTTYKINAGDDLEKVLDDFQPKNTGQLIEIMRQLDKVESQKTTDEADEAEQTSKAEQAQRVSEIRANWDQEVKDLTADKRIPAGEDGEKRVSDVFKFMADENDKRIAAKRPTIGSFEDALDKLEAQEARQKTAAEAKAERDAARSNGALVGGSSAPATASAPAYRAGSARNANQALRNLGLLK